LGGYPPFLRNSDIFAVRLTLSQVPDFRMTSSIMFLDGLFRASGKSRRQLNFLNDGVELQVFGKVIDTVIDRCDNTVWEPLFGSTGMIDSRYFGLDDIHKFCPTILAFQDFLNFSLAVDTHLRYKQEDMYKVLEDTFTQRYLRLLTPTDREFAVWLRLLSINMPSLPLLEGESLGLYLRHAMADLEMKSRFFDNPELQPLTELATWQIMCAMKMDPNAARCLHLVWAVSRGNTFFSTAEGCLGNGSRKMVIGDKIALIQGV